MLESLENRDEACYMVTEIVGSIFTEESDTISKLNYIQRAVTQAHSTIAVEDAVNLRQLMLNPKMAKYFAGAKFAVQDGSYLPVAADATAKQLTGIMSYVAASGLIFAHSFLESAIENLLKMSRLCDINSWVGFLSTKTIPVATILDSNVEVALEAKLKEFVEDIQKQSLLFKIEKLSKLLKRSITKSSVKNYTYDATRLQSIDDLRHELAHHQKKDYTIKQAEEDMRYLYRTAFHFLDLTVDKYNLQGQWRPASNFGHLT
jgi:hypothetical protein